MEEWRLLDLGGLPGIETQTVYEAVALARSKNLVPDTLILCYPENPLVCIGYHQDLEKEVEYSFCQSHGIPVVRRILGGGAVYLDQGQLFYQVIVDRKNPKIPLSIKEFFQKLLEAPTKTYQDLGIPAVYKPINDIEVNGKKISGNGAGTLENAVNIMTGNIIMDFNYEMMVKILKVPSEKFRDKVAKSLEERMTTIKKELGQQIPPEKIKSLLIKNYQETLDIKLKKDKLTDWEKKTMNNLKEKYQSPEWLNMVSLRHPDLARKVKISSTTSITESAYKAPGGLIRVTLRIDEETIKEIMISGDFWIFPENKLAELEKRLTGAPTNIDKINQIIENFYKEEKIETPGATPQDFLTAIRQAIE
ncbi:MAG: lipoate--protein ligase [Candidatus Jordarchaeaceae archaeon]